MCKGRFRKQLLVSIWYIYLRYLLRVCYIYYVSICGKAPGRLLPGPSVPEEQKEGQHPVSFEPTLVILNTGSASTVTKPYVHTQKRQLWAASPIRFFNFHLRRSLGQVAARHPHYNQL